MQFDQFASSYNDHAFIQKDLIEWGLDWIKDHAIADASIIEFGAGTGLLTPHLVKLTQRPSYILATDLSPSMIEEGKRRVPEANWQVMDAWNASPKDVAHIFSSSLLQWCPNPQETLSNWARHLKKAGRIHVLLFIDQTLKELREFVPLEGIIQWRTLTAWKSFFRNAELQVIASREHVKQYHFPNSLDLIKTLKHSGTGLRNCLSGGRLRQLLKDYDECYNFNKGVISTWQFCQIVAEKI